MQCVLIYGRVEPPSQLQKALQGDGVGMDNSRLPAEGWAGAAHSGPQERSSGSRWAGLGRENEEPGKVPRDPSPKAGAGLGESGFHGPQTCEPLQWL